MNDRVSLNTPILEPYSLIRDLLMNFWLVILAALIGLMAVSAWSRSVYIPQYTSSATLIVNVSDSSYYSYLNLQTSSQMAEIYTALLKTDIVKKQVAERLERTEFSGAIESEVLQNTNIFTVSVTTPSPMLSYEELCALLEVCPQISEAIFAYSVVEVMRKPNLPDTPANEIDRQFMSRAALGCAALMLGLISLLSLTRDTVKNVRIFRKEVDEKLFGIVSHESRSKTLKSFLKNLRRPNKTALLVGQPGISFDFTEEYHKIAVKMEYLRRNEGDRVFLITSCAENEGKSTASANIALTLAGRGKRVLLIDLDFMKPAVQKIFELRKTDSPDLADLLSGSIAPSAYRLKRLQNMGVDLAVNRESHPDYVDWIHSEHAQKMLHLLCGSERYDFVILDTPPFFAAADVTRMLRFADRSLLVVRTDYIRVKDIRDVIMKIRETDDRFAGCILNDVPRRSLKLYGTERNRYSNSRYNGQYRR